VEHIHSKRIAEEGFRIIKSRASETLLGIVLEEIDIIEPNSKSAVCKLLNKQNYILGYNTLDSWWKGTDE
jgi:hypothetical protein